MKKFALFMATVVGLFSSLFSSAAKAACDEGDETCGTNCCYHITEDRTATIYAGVEGEEAVFEQNVFEGIYDILEEAVFSEGITKISASVNAYYPIKNVYLPTSLTETNFEYLKDSGNLVIPDTLDTSSWFHSDDYYTQSGWAYVDPFFITCKGNIDVCKEKFANVQCGERWDYNTYDYVPVLCKDLIQGASEEYCTGANYHWNNGKCEYIGESGDDNHGGSGDHINCGEGKLEKDGICVSAAQGCGEGYRQFETWCNKVRWTPAEAAEKLTDDNNNSVTITFKK